MKIIDISWPITERMTEYKNRQSVKFIPLKEYVSDGVRETEIRMHAHTGTHVDAPSHFIADGKDTDGVELHTMIGSCTVLDFTHVQEKINEGDINSISAATSILLFKTKNSSVSADAPFDPNFVYISQAAAQALVNRNIQCVGFDYLGIERNQPQHETHELLLQHNVTIIEGLRLAAVQPGNYFLYCLPLAVVSIDAAPARAVLIAAD
jgi:arylformamidase